MLPLEKAKLSLDGLSVGDAFGEKFFGYPDLVLHLIEDRQLPDSPWFFTDDTVMAMGVVEVLEKYGHIDQNALARTFARNVSFVDGRFPGALGFLGIYFLHDLAMCIIYELPNPIRKPGEVGMHCPHHLSISGLHFTYTTSAFNAKDAPRV